MNDLNAPCIRLPMEYIAEINFSLSDALYRQAKKDGYCKTCAALIVVPKIEDTFYKDAGHGFNWIVSNQKSNLCENCYADLKAKSTASTYEAGKINRVGRCRENNVEYEIIEHDSDFDTPTEAESIMILTAIKLEDERMKHEELVDAILDLISEAGVTEPMHKQIDGLVAQYERDITSRISLRLGNIKENMMADIKEAVSQPA